MSCSETAIANTNLVQARELSDGEFDSDDEAVDGATKRLNGPNDAEAGKLYSMRTEYSPRSLNLHGRRESSAGGAMWQQLAEDAAVSNAIDYVSLDPTCVHARARGDRGVEAYDFKASLSDHRPLPADLPALAESEALLKLRDHDVKLGGIRARLGKRRGPEPLSNIDATIELMRIERANILKTASSEVLAYTNSLAQRLQEQNIVLLAHIVKGVGIERCERLAQMAVTIDSNGGMPTRDGKYKRTLGGTFLQLVKDDKDISKSLIRDLFKPYERYQKKIAKKRRKLQKAGEALDKLEKLLFNCES